eukprot:m.30044 g.30044  ORF g.30044 m.30044 type:complete len:99 (+) comp16204_c0_seq1:232-528(+)
MARKKEKKKKEIIRRKEGKERGKGGLSLSNNQSITFVSSFFDLVVCLFVIVRWFDTQIPLFFLGVVVGGDVTVCVVLIVVRHDWQVTTLLFLCNDNSL